MPQIIDDQFMSMFGGKDAAPAPTVAQKQAQGANLQAPPTSQAPQQQGGPAPAAQPQGGGIIDNQFTQMFGSAQPQAAPTNASSAPDTSGQTPESASDVSGVSFLDRLKMSVGNDAGSLAYLEQNYEDAKQLPDGRMVVKQGGKWSQVDPSGWGGGNAWDKAKEFAKDIADGGGLALNTVGGVVGTTLGGIAGATAGAAYGAPVGPAGLIAGAASGVGPGAIAGATAGGLVSGQIRTSLGRVVGTYQATPEDQLKDIGLEGLLNAGGEALAIGAKPVLSKVAGAVTSFAEGASDQAKQAMAALLSWTTKASPESTTRLMERAPDVMGQITAVQKSGMPSYKTDVGLAGRAMDYTKGLFQNAQKAFSEGFDAKETELLASVPGNFKADITQPIHQGMAGMVQSGLVRPVAGQSGVVQGYKLAPREDILKLFQNAENDGALNQQAWLKLKDYVEKANGYLQQGTKVGADAVDTLINIRRGFDKFYYAATDANPSMKQLLTPASSQMRQSLVQQIGSASPEVATKYADMNQMYQDTMPFVVEAGRVLRRFKGTETFVNSLQGGDKVMAGRMVETMARLKGQAGQDLADSLKDTIAARDFVAKLPQMDAGRLGGAALAGAGATAAHMGPLAAVVGAPLAAASSPRLVGRVAQGTQIATGAAADATKQAVGYASHLGDMLKSLAPDQMKQFISDPNLFPAAVRATLQAGRQEQGLSQQLLQSHGIPTQQPGNQ
jgi:hypothetical protein